jgi:membrane protein DedA with SNARE-associated domain
MAIIQELLQRYTYGGILAVLLLGSLGLPVPEEMPIVAAGVLSHQDLARWWLALPVCVVGALSGDMILYWVGRRWGDRVRGWWLVRHVLTPERTRWLEEAYREHAMKTVITARHVAGLRAAAFLSAGMARVPLWKFALADAAAATVTIPITFGLAYFFSYQINAILADVHRLERWAALAGLVALAGFLVHYMLRSGPRLPRAH